MPLRGVCSIATKANLVAMNSTGTCKVNIEQTVRKLKSTYAVFLVAVLGLVGCATPNDFKVVDALHSGMTRAEAEQTIQQHGFTRQETVVRPSGGWTNIQTTMHLPERAAAVELRRGLEIQRADYYPVYHGMFGFGELFLFYDAGERLVEFYRVNIN